MFKIQQKIEAKAVAQVFWSFVYGPLSSTFALLSSAIRLLSFGLAVPP
jgi:hypothetical protein